MADRDILPDTFKPRHYDLVITDLDFVKWTYQGKVVIDGHLKRATSELALNAQELTLTAAELSCGSAAAVKSKQITYDKRKQRATIHFESEVALSGGDGEASKLTISFTGIMNSDMAGFYRSKYKPAVPPAASTPRDSHGGEDGGFAYMLSTQFEACDACRAFPCWDEPALKATFDFAIEIPEDLVALSNMPVKKESADKSSGNGKTKLVRFDRTPVMSTYLLAWAVGDFEYIESHTAREYQGKKLPVRVYTTRGLKEQGRYALDHAPRVIDLFSEIFEIDYPLPKSDLLAVHEFTSGAMENWGLVTYRTSAVLFNEATSDPQYRNRVAYVVAHELAHQWFGNLVTMAWWDELWLNEGFATWVGWLAIDRLHPEWRVWAQFVGEGMDQALKMDAVRASHAVHVPVRDALDVNQIFDAISYLKGCSAIRMLAAHLGIDVFLKGVAKYLKAHAYANATTQDLWAALSETSGKDVSALMGAWIGNVGFPVIMVEESGKDLKVSQTRFLSTGDVDPATDDTTTWWVPLLLKTGASDGDESQKPATLELTDKSRTISGVLTSHGRDDDSDFYLVNSGATGFYRVNYPSSRLTRLSRQLHLLTEADRIFTLASAFDMSFAGLAPVSGLLDLAAGLRPAHESALLVWTQALSELETIKGIFYDHVAVHDGLSAFINDLITPVVRAVGWTVPKDEDFLRGLLRRRMMLTAVANNHEEVTKEALRRWDALVSGSSKETTDDEKSLMPPSLRTTVYRAGAQARPEEAVRFLKKEWAVSGQRSPDAKEACLASLAQVRNAKLLREEVIPFLLGSPSSSEEPGKVGYVASEDVYMMAAALSSNSLARPLLWEAERADWAQVVRKTSNATVLDRFMRASLEQFTDEGIVADVDAFFADKDIQAFARTLETVKDKIRARARFRQRAAADLESWLREKGFVKET